jgi:hypothetical protein
MERTAGWVFGLVSGLGAFSRGWVSGRGPRFLSKKLKKYIAVGESFFIILLMKIAEALQ